MSATLVAGERRAALPRAVWEAAAVALAGTAADTFVMFLLLWQAEPQGWSPAQVALVVVVLRLPTLLVGFVAGRAVDRLGARPVVLIDLTMRAVLFAAIAATGLQLAAVLVLGGLAGALSPATYAAVRALIPRLVDGERQARANRAVAISDQVPLLLGTVLVGPAIATIGPRASLLIPVVLLLGAAVLARRLPTGAPAPPPICHVEGTHRPVPARAVGLVALSAAYYFAYGPFETATPAFVRDELGAGAGTYSLLWTLFGVGAVVGMLATTRLADHPPGRVNAGGALLWGLVMVPVPLLDGTAVVAALFLLGGLVWGPYSTIETLALQRWADPARLGVLFGVQRSILASAAPLGAAAGALGLEWIGPDTVLLLSAGSCALAGAIALSHRDLRDAH
jgi:predicted MFS family arabinose efflux permease